MPLAMAIIKGGGSGRKVAAEKEMGKGKGTNGVSENV